jgi:hypothetical protein
MFSILCDPAIYEVRRFSAVFKRENRRSMRLLERLADARAGSLAAQARRW